MVLSASAATWSRADGAHVNEVSAFACLLAAWALAACGDHGGGLLFYALAELVAAAGLSLSWGDQGQP